MALFGWLIASFIWAFVSVASVFAVTHGGLDLQPLKGWPLVFGLLWLFCVGLAWRALAAAAPFTITFGG